MENLYTLLQERLQKISAQIIGAHRKGNSRIPFLYAQQANFTLEQMQLPANRLFMQVIQVYHPDKAKKIWNDLKQRNASAIQLEGAIKTAFKLLTDQEVSNSQTREASHNRETYAYGTEDFGYSIYDWEDLEETEDFEDDFFSEYSSYQAAGLEYEEEDIGDFTFIAALQREMFGNLDIYLSASDAEKLEGELDLSDSGISDLSGAEFCTNIMQLNLAHNNIQNVYPLRHLYALETLDLSENQIDQADELRGLKALKELDLSYNDIDDFTFLLELPELLWVNVLGNPAIHSNIVAKLKEHGVFVLK